MDGVQMNSITGVGSAASAKVASALIPRHTNYHAVANGAATAKATTGGSATASDAANSANITSNDFLVLLVSELKNQDPTQPTDPNAYIQQLVGVNSLQQLIQINHGLATIEGPATSTPTGAAPAGNV